MGEGVKDYIKICISHEVGHAMQEDLNQYAFMLNSLKSEGLLMSLKRIEDLEETVMHYKNTRILIEENAWDRAEILIKVEIDPVYFNLIKNNALSTYKEADYIEEDKTFHHIYTNLLK